MIAKKNSRFDLEQKKNALFFIGLLTAGSFTLAAFTYATPISNRISKKDFEFRSVEFAMEIEEIKKEEIILQQQEKPQSDQQQKSIDASLDVTEDISEAKNLDKEPEATVKISAPDWKTGEDLDMDIDFELEDEILNIVDKDAEYIGGTIAMHQFIIDNFKPSNNEFGDAGTVYVVFVIEKDGSISNVGIERGVSTEIDREAKRVVRMMPKWRPAENNFELVRTRVRFPIVVEAQ